MDIPRYILLSVYNHYNRISNNVKPNPNDIRTADALRLSKSDLRKLHKHLFPEQYAASTLIPKAPKNS